jgi:Cd2+/Zn2+-exporting ATPase
VVTDAKNYAGMGVSAVVDGVRYYAGNEKLMQKIGVPFTETQLVGTAVYCCTDTEFLGDIVFADIIKTDSREAIDLQTLRRRNPQEASAEDDKLKDSWTAK